MRITTCGGSTTPANSTEVRGIPFTVCALDTLRELAEPVLLDMDIDFFTLPVVGYFRDRPGERPWMWPEALTAALRARIPRVEMVTIAYPVAGGYTPLKWKYLGDALALEWRRPDVATASERTGYQCLRRAADAGGGSAALEALELAAVHLPRSAAPYFHLALHHLNSDIRAAQRAFARAVQVDPTYGGAYCCRGFVCLYEHRAGEAEAEFQRVVALDPASPFAQLGLARIAILARRWTDAEAGLRRSIDAAPRLVDAHRYLADVLVTLGRDTEAAAAYSRSLRLVLEGEVPIDEAIRTALGGGDPRDGRHDTIYAALARMDARAGRLQSAVSGYRMAIAAGADVSSVHGRLAIVYGRQQSWMMAMREAARAVALLPRSVRKLARRVT